MKEGRLAPVPHQWVEWSEQGYPFFEEDGSTDRIGDPRRIDAEDRLLLRFEDGGPSLSGQTTESVVAQLAVTHGEQAVLSIWSKMPIYRTPIDASSLIRPP